MYVCVFFPFFSEGGGGVGGDGGVKPAALLWVGLFGSPRGGRGLVRVSVFDEREGGRKSKGEDK